MKKTTCMIFLMCMSSLFMCAQKRYEGEYLFNNGIDSVYYTIRKNHTYKSVSNSICSGDKIFYCKGKWMEQNDSIRMLRYSKKYTFGPVDDVKGILRNDTLLLFYNRKEYCLKIK